MIYVSGARYQVSGVGVFRVESQESGVSDFTKNAQRHLPIYLPRIRHFSPFPPPLFTSFLVQIETGKPPFLVARSMCPSTAAAGGGTVPGKHACISAVVSTSASGRGRYEHVFCTRFISYLACCTGLHCAVRCGAVRGDMGWCGVSEVWRVTCRVRSGVVTSGVGRHE